MPMRDATVAQRYASLVESGALTVDPAQARIVRALDTLRETLAARSLARKSSSLGWLFARKPAAASIPKGLYIHGGVGRGKTMLMDLFFQQVASRSKRRIHFNDFMADVHDRIQKHRKARKDGETSEDDPIPPVARQIAGEASLLCFDEFSVTDIADAMVLSRLFQALFAEGVVLVATSNVAPRDLYRDGLNRALFEPFIDLLEARVDVLCLDSPTDHRLAKLARLPVYVTPLGPEADRQLDEAFEAATEGRPAAATSVVVKGRTIPVPVASGATARFSFAELCEKPLGARDYIAIAERFRTVFVDRIPVLDAGRRNEAKRLILLIDTLYDRHVRLFASAAAAPDGLYSAPSGTEAFEFARTASRLMEMQSRDWQDAWSKENRSGAQRAPDESSMSEV
jgi:cell division protein ZapE